MGHRSGWLIQACVAILASRTLRRGRGLAEKVAGGNIEGVGETTHRLRRGSQAVFQGVDGARREGGLKGQRKLRQPALGAPVVQTRELDRERTWHESEV